MTSSKKTLTIAEVRKKLGILGVFKRLETYYRTVDHFITATTVLHREDDAVFSSEVIITDYDQSGNSNHFSQKQWKSIPYTMLGHVSVRSVASMAYPEEFADSYLDTEYQESKPVKAEEPAELEEGEEVSEDDDITTIMKSKDNYSDLLSYWNSLPEEKQIVKYAEVRRSQVVKFINEAKTLDELKALWESLATIDKVPNATAEKELKKEELSSNEAGF